MQKIQGESIKKSEIKPKSHETVDFSCFVGIVYLDRWTENLLFGIHGRATKFKYVFFCLFFYNFNNSLHLDFISAAN